MAESSTPFESVRGLPALPPRAPESHKGDYGRTLVVAGSRGMTGAAVLAGTGAVRAGAGLVTVAMPEGICSIIAGHNPCYMLEPLPETDDGTLSLAAKVRILSLMDTNDVMVIGPGLSRNEDVIELVLWLILMVNKPMVIDADGVNAIQEDVSLLQSLSHTVVLTPHPGELGRLARLPAREVVERRLELAVEFARRENLYLALKGHRTIVTDGRRVYFNETGNPGMASGGVGDVLAGMIGALIGQGVDPFEATQLGVHVHGLAGDLAVEHYGLDSLCATDVLDYLPAAFKQTRAEQ